MLSSDASFFVVERDKYFRARDTLPAVVGMRPLVTAPKFGRWLQMQRGRRSLEQIAIQVRPLVKPAGLKVDQSHLYKMEKGRVPSWPMLAALCRVYKVDIRGAVVELIDALEFPGSVDLLCQADGVQHASNLHGQEGGAPYALPADPSTHLIADELRSIADSFVGAIQDVADRLAGGMADPPPPHPAGDAGADETDRVRRTRKVG